VKKERIGRLRKIWLINPRSRVKTSKKLYKRQQAKQELKKQIKEDLRK